MGALIARILVLLGVSQATASKVGEIATLAGILAVLMWIASFLKRMIGYPLFLGAVVLALTLFPETVGWIFIKIGEIELNVMALVLAQIMPDVFNTGWDSYSSWADLWQAGLNALPQDMLEIINGLGVAQLLGMVTSTIGAIGLIHLYRRCMIRAGLM